MTAAYCSFPQGYFILFFAVILSLFHHLKEKRVEPKGLEKEGKEAAACRPKEE